MNNNSNLIFYALNFVNESTGWGFTVGCQRDVCACVRVHTVPYTDRDHFL